MIYVYVCYRSSNTDDDIYVRFGSDGIPAELQRTFCFFSSFTYFQFIYSVEHC